MPHKTVAKTLIQPNAKTPHACVSKRADHKHLRDARGEIALATTTL